MKRHIVAVALGVWFVMAALAIANGILRQALLVPALGDAVAQIVSLLILGAIIAAIQWRLVRGRWSTLSPRYLALIGAFWMLATILFEFGLGRLVLGMSWNELLAQYDLLSGNLWPLIPLLMLVGMPLMRLRGTR